PAVAIEVADRYGSAERGDVWFDVGDLRVEGGPLMDKGDARCLRLVTKGEAGMRRVRERPDRTAVQSHGEENCGKEGHGHDAAPNGRAGTLRHVQRLMWERRFVIPSDALFAAWRLRWHSRGTTAGTRIDANIANRSVWGITPCA